MNNECPFYEKTGEEGNGKLGYFLKKQYSNGPDVREAHGLLGYDGRILKNTENISEREEQAKTSLQNLRNISEKEIIKGSFSSFRNCGNIYTENFDLISNKENIINIAFKEIVLCQTYLKDHGVGKQEAILLIKKMMFTGEGTLCNIQDSLEAKNDTSIHLFFQQVEEVCKLKGERINYAANYLQDIEYPFEEKGIRSCPFTLSSEYEKWLDEVWEIFENKYIPSVEKFLEKYEKDYIFHLKLKIKDIVGEIIKKYTRK